MGNNPVVDNDNTEIYQEAIEVLQDHGYLGYEKDTFVSSAGNKRNALDLLKVLNFPSCIQDSHPVLFSSFCRKQDRLLKLTRYMRAIPVPSPTKSQEEENFEKFNTLDELEPNKELILNLKDGGAIVRRLHRGTGKNPEFFVVNPKLRAVFEDFDPMTVVRIWGVDPKILKTGELSIADTIFDPTTTKFFLRKKLHTTEVIYCNTFQPPSWMKWIEEDCEDRVDGKLPDYINRFFQHLFIDAEERELIYDWLHYCLVDRARTHLMLLGEKAIGKNFFFTLIRKLIGPEYSGAGTQSNMDERFNENFIDKRLMIFDEVTLYGTTAINNLKRWGNDRIPIEGKGIEVREVDNRISYVFLSNNITSFTLAPDERRMSIPDLTEIPLTQSSFFKPEEFKDFCRLLENDTNEESEKFIAQFGRFLIDRKPKIKSDEPIKGDYFFWICAQGCPQWIEECKAEALAATRPDPTRDKTPEGSLTKSAYDLLPDDHETPLDSIHPNCYKISWDEVIQKAAKTSQEKLPRKIAAITMRIKAYAIRGEIPMFIVKRIKSSDHKETTYLIPTKAAIDALRREEEIATLKRFGNRKFDLLKNKKLSHSTQNSEIETEEGDLL